MALAREVSLVADVAALGPLEPLLAVWRRRPGGVRIVDGGIPGSAELVDLASASEAVLVVGSRRRAPRTVLPAPAVVTPDGRAVSVAWLPHTCDTDLRTFASAAASVHARTAVPGRVEARTFAVLGERHPRFDRLADRIVRLAGEDGALTARRWTAYEVDRAGLANLLGDGPGLAVYVGHGRPIGWVGYAGLRAHHLVPGAPVGALISLTCKTASRRRTGLSFAEAVPLKGIAAVTLGAVGPTRHTSNARWALRLTRAASSAATVGDLVAAITPHDAAAAAYRLIGDPTAPLLDATHALVEAS